jgi:DNA-binding response OmpR family regulator
VRKKKRAEIHVLIADDDELILEFLQTVLAGDGVVVTAVTDGQSALDAAMADPPDVVVLDVMMPGLDGFEVLRRLRENEATKRTPIAMLTSRDERPEIVGGLLLGANDYIVKSLPAEEIAERVLSLLEER